MFQITPWIMRLLNAFDYLNIAGYPWTGTQKAALTNWFHNFAVYMDTGTVSATAGTNYPGIFNTPQNLTFVNCTGPGNLGLTYFGGFTVYDSTYYSFFNKWTGPFTIDMTVGIMTNDSTLKQHAIAYYTAFMKAGTYDDGSRPDFVRWHDCADPCSGGMWGHADMSTQIALADMLARTGDTSLYDLNVPNVTRGATGATVGLRKILELWASLINETTFLYGTTNSSQLNSTYQLNWDTGTPSGLTGSQARYSHFSHMIPNRHFQYLS